MATMSLHPSYISPPIVFDDQPLPPLKPKKWYGIVSILCGAYPIFALAYVFLVGLLVESGIVPEPSDVLIVIILAPIFATPLFVIAGLVFGFLGLDTEGRHYAITGFVLSSLTAQLTFGTILLISL